MTEMKCKLKLKLQRVEMMPNKGLGTTEGSTA